MQACSSYGSYDISAIPSCNSCRLGPMGHAFLFFGKKARSRNWRKRQNHDYNYGYLRLSILKK